MEQKTHKDFEAKLAELNRARSKFASYTLVIAGQATTMPQPDGQWDDETSKEISRLRREVNELFLQLGY